LRAELARLAEQTKSRLRNRHFVTTVTAKSFLRSEDGTTTKWFTSIKEGAMPHVPYRVYDVELPYHVPCFGVGIAISKFKQIGVWHKFPHTLKEKAKEAKGSWSGLKITQKDLDSIPDDAWEIIAVELGVEWRYATAAIEHDRKAAAAYGTTPWAR
jgi:hypothetical protein